MKKFVVTGASTYGVKNMGDDAMLASMVQGLRRSSPGCDITFLCRHPDEDYDKAFGFTSLKNLDHDTRDAAAGRVFWGMNKDDPTDHLRAISDAIRDADLLIIGGNSFMEIFPNSFLKGVSTYGATLATLARFLGTPIALYGVNVVDDINEATTQQHAKFMVDTATAVTMREQSGKNFLADVGVTGDHVAVLGDPAFGMEPQSTGRAPNDIVSADGISLSGRPVITVGFRHEYWKGDESSYDSINAQLAEMLDSAAKTFDADILFVPNCTYTLAHKWQDDRLTHREIAGKMALQDRVHCIEQDLSVFETFSLFSLSSMHLSNRRHSCIFAAMNAVPFLSIASVLKGHMQPFLDELGVSGQIAAISDMDDLHKKLEQTWHQRVALTAAMKPNVDALREEAKKHIPYILSRC